jgi:hypothetical protein
MYSTATGVCLCGSIASDFSESDVIPALKRIEGH